MSEKVALVTGGNRGIGASICRELGKAGYFVYINCRNISDDALHLLDEIKMNHGNGSILEFDVRDARQIERACEGFIHEKLDLLVNNAGILKDNLLYQINKNDWNDILGTNFFGAVRVFERFKGKLEASASSTVISIASISGVRPRKGQGAYSISKAMLIDWTKEKAKLLKGSNISFYAISPGSISTDMIKSAAWYNSPESLERIPLGRFGEPGEVSELVILLSDELRVFQNGANIVFDGGSTQTTRK